MDQVLRMLMRMFMRHGMRFFASRGGKADPQSKQATRAARMANRIGRM